MLMFKVFRSQSFAMKKKDRKLKQPHSLKGGKAEILRLHDNRFTTFQVLAPQFGVLPCSNVDEFA